MNWEILSTVSETLSSIAVLLTLIYLAIQTRQNAEAVQASTRQAILGSDQQFTMYVMDNPEIEMLRYKQNLSDEEKIRLGFFCITFIRMRENNWLQHKRGVLDDATWATYRRSIAVALAPQSSRLWWQNYSAVGTFDAAFVSLVDEVLANAPVSRESHTLAAFGTSSH